MLALRIFLQHWQNKLNVDTIKRLGPVCRETARFCRAIEDNRHFDRFESHMRGYALNFWYFAKDYFEGDREFHFAYNENFPMCDVSIYTGLKRDDLDFLDEFDYDEGEYYDDYIIVTTYDIPGLTKKIYIHYSRKRHGSMFHRENYMIKSKIIADIEEEYNYALEMISTYRKNILSVKESNLRCFPIRGPYVHVKRILQEYKRRVEMCDLIDYFDTVLRARTFTVEKNVYSSDSSDESSDDSD